LPWQTVRTGQGCAACQFERVFVGPRLRRKESAPYVGHGFVGLDYTHSALIHSGANPNGENTVFAGDEHLRPRIQFRRNAAQKAAIRPVAFWSLANRHRIDLMRRPLTLIISSPDHHDFGSGYRSGLLTVRLAGSVPFRHQSRPKP
jgi:hypothetical protein